MFGIALNSPEICSLYDGKECLLSQISTEEKSKEMSRVCQVTGKRTISGNNVSKSRNKTKRKFYPNLQKKRFFLPEEKQWITLKVSTSGIRIINKRGITSVVKELREKGEIK